jgi:DNA-binding PadR family transcriptional regulator
MEANGWLERSGDALHARARQTFRITREGKGLLSTLRREVTELYEEVVLGREPEHTKAESNLAKRQPRPRKRTARRTHTARRRS